MSFSWLDLSPPTGRSTAASPLMANYSRYPGRMNNRNVDRSQAGAYGQDHGGRGAPKGRSGTVGRGQQVAGCRGEKSFAPTRDRGWSPLDGRCRHPGGDSLMVVTPAWGQSFWEPFQRLSRAWPAPTPMDVSAGASPARDFVHYSTVGVRQAGLGVHPVAALLAGEMKAEEKENAIEHSPWDGGYARHSRGWLPARNGRESSMWLGPSSRFSSLPVAGRKPASLRTVSRVPIS